MKSRYNTPTFKRFAIGFFCIIAAAFGVMLVASQYAPAQPSDTLATPR